MFTSPTPPIKCPAEQSNRIQKEAMENRQNNEAAQRERYYATIHKVSLQNNDKIPGKINKNQSNLIII